MATALLLDNIYKQHLTGPGHPERPERYDAVRAGLERDGLVRDAKRIAPRRANEDEIAICHTRDYIALAHPSTLSDPLECVYVSANTPAPHPFLGNEVRYLGRRLLRREAATSGALG